MLRKEIRRSSKQICNWNFLYVAIVFLKVAQYFAECVGVGQIEADYIIHAVNSRSNGLYGEGGEQYLLH